MIQTRRSSYLLVSGVVITALLHVILILFAPHLHPIYTVVSVSVWSIAIIIAIVRNPDPALFRKWGFRTDNLAAAFVAPTAYALFALVIMALIGRQRGSLALPLHSLIVFALYPIWGLVQQFLLQAVLIGSIERPTGLRSKPWFLAIVSGLLFGAIHPPFLLLMLATALMALGFTPMYLRWRNLWPLGLYHGLLGVLILYWVLGKDVWLDALKLFN